jgi:branched-chain amino acid transport system ATP-binding protein
MAAPHTLAPQGDDPSRSAIALHDISLAFGGLDVLRDVSLEVRRGEIVGLIGPNGAGKSSLLNVMSGFYRADRGGVSIGGTRLDRLRPQRVARAGVVRTFQNLGLFGGMTVLDNVLTGRALHGKAGWPHYLFRTRAARNEDRRNRTLALDALASLDLQEHADTLVSALPYGAQKRVELARALAMAPQTLLLDEPLAGMNPDEKHEMVSAIRATRGIRGTTVVLIEHDIGVVLTLANRLVVLDRGRVIADGLPATVAADSAVIAAYLGTRH